MLFYGLSTTVPARIRAALVSWRLYPLSLFRIGLSMLGYQWLMRVFETGNEMAAGNGDFLVGSMSNEW